MSETIAVIIIFILIGIIIFTIGLSIGANIQEKKLRKTILNWENIVECFKDVNWSINTFESYSGNILTSKNGESKFYAIKPIDEAIKKLNSLDRIIKK